MKPAKQSKLDVRDIRILLVDDHPGVRQGLALLLAPEGMEVCAEAGSSSEALAQLTKHDPDLAIVDLSLDGEDGVTLITELHKRSIRVLVYSMHKDARHVQGAFSAGALGYVTKRELHSVLVQAIREVAAARRFVSPIASAALAENLTKSSADGGLDKLSLHERRVYDLLGEGADTYDIADTLSVTNHTVESYYSRILVKLSLNGMHELRRHAIAHLQKNAT